MPDEHAWQKTLRSLTERLTFSVTITLTNQPTPTSDSETAAQPRGTPSSSPAATASTENPACTGNNEREENDTITCRTQHDASHARDLLTSIRIDGDALIDQATSYTRHARPNSND